jgi:cell division protein FtsB
MNVDLGIWAKLTRAVVFLFILAGLLAIAVWYQPLIHQNERIRRELLNLDARLQKEKEINKELKASIDAFSDPKTVERLAREKLGYAKPGETVIRFSPEPSTNHPAQAR